MTLEQYQTYQEGVAERDKRTDTFMWLMGRYVADAVAAVLSDRKHPHRYPDRPYMEQADENVILDGSGLSEEDKEAARMKSLREMGLDPEAMMQEG